MINSIILGDCLEKMKELEESSIDLIYLDPPFFTEKKHCLKNRERTQEFSFEDIWGNYKAYAEFLLDRIVVMKRLLRDTGAIFVHCDTNGSHIIRALLDRIFGETNFQSEIIWMYKRWSNSKKGLLANHQNIYFYSKTKSFQFHKIYKEYSETTNIDQLLQKRTRDKHNKSIYAMNKNGTYQYGGKKKGVPLSDVWDIPYLNPKAKERVGYPTQKPLLLLERIIQIVTNEGDIVLDPFCGSGTTCVAAKLLKRNFIGIDIADQAVNLTNKRLENPVKTESMLLQKGRHAYKNADIESLSLLTGVKYYAVQRNKGIDAILEELYDDAPVFVRIQKQGESLLESIKLLQNVMKRKRSKCSILIQTQPSKHIPKSESIIIIPSPALQLKNILL